MGEIDAQAKAYMKDPRIFADMFNQYIYKGRQMIQPEQLRPNDTAKVALPYGNEGKPVSLQCIRIVMRNY